MSKNLNMWWATLSFISCLRARKQVKHEESNSAEVREHSETVNYSINYLFPEKKICFYLLDLLSGSVSDSHRRCWTSVALLQRLNAFFLCWAIWERNTLLITEVYKSQLITSHQYCSDYLKAAIYPIMLKMEEKKFCVFVREKSGLKDSWRLLGGVTERVGYSINRTL